MIRAAYDERLRSIPQRPSQRLLGLTIIDKRYMPGRGILYSILVHSMVIYGLLFVSVSANFTEAPYRPVRVTMVNLRDPNYKMYLPVLFGADPPQTDAPKGPKVSEPEPKRAPVVRSTGFSYPGPQPIVSDFPNPTNRIQTILQPALQDPPIVPPPLNLPNIVRLADAVPPPSALIRKPIDAVKHPELQPAPPDLRPEKAIELPVKVVPPPVNLKNVVLPVSGSQNTPDVAVP